MEYKFVHKFHDGGTRIIDAQNNDVEELLKFYISDNGRTKGVLEIYEKNEKKEFVKIREIKTGDTKGK